MINLDQVYRYSTLLNIKCIKKEFEEFIKGFTIKKIKRETSGYWICHFENENGESLILYIVGMGNNIILTKWKDNLFERVSINRNLFLVHEVIEKRPNGIISSIIKKEFDFSDKYKNASILVDLVEQRFVFSREKLESLLDNCDFDNTKMILFVLMLSSSSKKSKCDYFTEFSTHMYNYGIPRYGREIKDNICSTRTYLNGDEVSAIFDINDGEDKLYRIYDLYNGIINQRNENEIYAINLGLLTPDSYNLKALRGITDKEDSIVGKSLISDDEEYLKYLKEMLYKRAGFKGNLELNRDSILSAITYKMSSSELVKRQIEEKLGISYEEFDNMDYYEQRKLIEEKTGKKVKLDYRLHTDGIPIDEDHILTINQVDRRIDELTATSPKKLLKNLLNSFVKK